METVNEYGVTIKDAQFLKDALWRQIVLGEWQWKHDTDTVGVRSDYREISSGGHCYSHNKVLMSPS